MRILELEISEIRGIRHLHLKPDGKNLVIWGPNGSGKSAVIDAVDFLFTGRMRRLIGEGTAGITLKRHGPHIDTNAENSFVRGIVQCSDTDPPIEIIRRLPMNALETSIEPKGKSAAALEIASRGQNILTRREILKFITADAGTRGEQIQALLDLVSVETTRKAFAQAENRCQVQWSEATAALTQARSRLALSLGTDDPSTEDVVEFINQKRALLGAGPLANPALAELKKGIVSPDQSASLPTGFNPDVFANHLKLVRHHLSEEGTSKIQGLGEEFQSRILAIDPEVLQGLKRVDLIKRGLSLVDASGACPLCERRWDPEELRARLRERVKSLESLAKGLTEAEGTLEKVRQHLTNTSAGIQAVLDVLGDTSHECKGSRIVL